LIDDVLRQYIDEIFKPKNLANISFDEYLQEINENETIKKDKGKRKDEQKKLKYEAKNKLVSQITNLYANRVLLN
jgi:hypothetical protein